MNVETQKLSIVQAGPWDAAAVAALLEDFRKFYNQAPDQELAHRFVMERLEHGDSVVFLGTVTNGGTPFPVAFAQMYPAFSSLGLSRIWILNDLFVTPDYRRRGYGRALVQACIDHARKTNAASIILETGIDNEPAKSLYTKLGFARSEDFHPYTLNLK